MILGNVLHMIIVRKNWLAPLAVPISPPLFGKNKTARGLVVLPLLSGTIALINSIAFGPFIDNHFGDLFVGAGLGLVYLLSELPNSFIKRKLGIANGEQSANFRMVQIFFDKADSLIGILIFYYWVAPVQWPTVVALFFISFCIHLTISHLLVLLKVKQSL